MPVCDSSRKLVAGFLLTAQLAGRDTRLASETVKTSTKHPVTSKKFLEGEIMSKSVKYSAILVLMFSVMHRTAHGEWHNHQLKCITNNNSVNAAAGERQLYFGVALGDSWQNNNNPKAISFNFVNYVDNGSAPMVVERVVFDFPTGMNCIGSSSGNFTYGVLAFEPVYSPQTALPGGNNIVPSFHNDYEFRASYGMRPGYSFNAQLYFDVRVDTYDIENAINTGAFKVGFYVDHFANGGNESFASIPEPATIALLALGGLMLRKRKI
jgi:hypothetical protein